MKKKLQLMGILLLAGLLAVNSAYGEKADAENIVSHSSDKESSAGLTGPVLAELESIPASGNLTLMVYLCGSTLEERNEAASRDILEMAGSGFSPETVNVLIMTGGAHRWGLSVISSGGTGIYQIGNGGLRSLWNEGKHYNMGDAETLRFFLQFAYERFPADQYALILWNHGGGSIHGICKDTIFKDHLSTDELEAALRKSPFSDQKLSWIGFDACVMGSGEVARAVSPFARYMFASEENEPASGWDYGFLHLLTNGGDPAEAGKAIAELYMASCEIIAEAQKHSVMFTFSGLDLSLVDELAEQMEAFFASVSFAGDHFVQVSRTRRTIVAFGRNEEKPERDFDLIDLGDMIEKFSAFAGEEKASKALNALQACVIINETTISNRNGTGISVYFPYYNKETYSNIRGYYDSLSLSKNYAVAIYAFGDELLRGTAGGEWTQVNNVQKGSISRDNRTIVQLKLEEDQAEYADLAEIIALRRLGEQRGWQLIAKQKAFILETGMASGEYVHTNLFVTDASGRPIHSAPLIYVERDDGLFALPVILTDKNGNRTEARLICALDEQTARLTVTEVYLYDTETDGFSPRLSGRLSDYVSAAYIVEEKQPVYYDEIEKGPLMPFEAWKTVGTQEKEWNLEEEWGLQFVRDYLDTEDVSVLFQITDVYNNVYLSKPISITGEAQTIQLSYDDNHRVLIDQNSLKLTPDRTLFFRAKNLSGAETLMSVTNMKINGVNKPGGTSVPGFGENGGLEPGEEKMVILKLPAEEGETIREICFDLCLMDAGEENTEYAEVVLKAGPEAW